MRILVAMMLVLGTSLGMLAPREAMAQARGGAVIQSVIIEGTSRIDPETVGSYLKLRVGDRFDSGLMDESLKALFETGLFRDVTVRREGEALVVRVVENPIINRIAFEGNRRVSDSDLLSEITLRPRSVYTRPQVEEAVRRMLAVYRATGRFGATVTPKIINLPQNRVDLAFEIEEGAVTTVRRISFVGNEAFSDSRLRDELQTRETAWWRFLGTSDVYDPDRVNFDKEMLRRFYQSRGYAEFAVVSAIAELTPDKRNFFITFTVSEGELYRFGKVDVVSRLPETEADQFARALRMKEGDRFNADKIEETINEITDAAGTLGFAFVRVVPRTEVDRETQTVNVTFEVREGPRVFVERIEVLGNIRTRDEVIRREMLIAEGDAFNTNKIQLSRRRLINLDFFEKVEITNRPGSAPDRTIVTVQVSEKATGELSLGAGFSTQDGVLGSFGIREKNFMGRGQDIATAFTISQRSTQLDLNFTEPYFLNRNLSFGVDLFRVDQSFDNESGFRQRQLGSRFRFGFRYTEFLQHTVAYNIANSSIRNIDPAASLAIQGEAGTTTTSSIISTLLYDRRDNRLDPTEGYVLRLESEFAGLGGSERFVKNRFQGAYYYPLRRDWVMSFIGEFGDVRGTGSSNARLNERFFVGGNNFRGFAFGGVGVRDAVTGDALGAKHYYLMSAELAFPLGLPREVGLQGRVFTDIGAAWGIDETFGARVLSSAAPRVSAGVGFSWRSPLGPLRFDLGFPLVKKAGDRTQVFNFRFGTRF